MNLFLYLSKQRRLRRWMETSPTAHRLTSRFIAGLTVEEAVRVATELRAMGARSTLNHLGENVSRPEDAERARDAYVEAVRAAAPLEGTIAMKLTAIGLDESKADTLVRLAVELGTRVEIDMEESSFTERTLQVVYKMHERHGGGVRAVIQAYLYRSEKDIETLCDRRIPVRLCKGAYNEPATVAYPNKADVDSNYIKLMNVLLERGTDPALATHDDNIIEQAVRHPRDRQTFEFQMLHGVRRDLQARVVKEGYRLRVYVPYGAAWYPYFMRRLGERPANVLFLARSLMR